MVAVLAVTELTGDDDHLHVILDTSLSQRQVAELFNPSFWQVRKCSWTDYEISCAWADLVFEGEGEILMHGPVAKAEEHAEQILAPLRSADVHFKAEFYDSKGNLLWEVEE